MYNNISERRGTGIPRQQPPPLKTVYLPPVEFSRGNPIYFVSLETLRASNRPVERGHTRLLYRENCQDLSLRSF